MTNRTCSYKVYKRQLLENEAALLLTICNSCKKVAY